MKPIQMVDTKSQYLKIKHQVDAALQDVLDSAAYINGKWVNNFANDLSAYQGGVHTIPCANGTDALQIALMALDLQPGDEVITPSFTYIATTEVVALLRLTPVFVEVDPDTFCMSPDSLKKAITPKTKAIVPVHLYGHSAPMDEILAIAAEHGIPVVEDNAQAIGCTYTFPDGTTKKTGTMGHIGTTSFYPSKNLGAYGDGGAIFTGNADLAGQMKMIANHGQQKRYYHERVGCNSRLDSIQAAILGVKLQHLDDYNRARQSVAAFYNQAFANHPHIQTPKVAAYSSHVYHQYTILVKNGKRDALSAYLSENQIPSMIYYPVPGHRQPMFTGLKMVAGDLSVTDWLTDRVISLPVHTEMEEEQLQYISEKVLEFFS
ncbi:MAG: DegT/DnrJ/EryC1/StrS family aminotransferase [Chitinophagia bacterium]|jgi:dTDP-4-amino-4,6-dideoxygalactose transaminase